MKVAVIGSGFVGSTTAFQLAMSGVANEILLIDIDTNKAVSQAQDIFHATPNSNHSKVISGEYSDLKNADVIIFAAGVNQNPSEARLNILKTNIKIFQDIVPKAIQNSPNAILVIATTPVDIMTKFTLQLSGFDKSKVIGCGCVIDSARFVSELSIYFGVSSSSVQAAVLGEHGDNAVLMWSIATAGFMPLKEFAEQIGKPITGDVEEQITKNIKNSSKDIVDGKKAIYFGIAAALTKVCRAIVQNTDSILPVSTFQKEICGVHDICISLPTVLNRNGAQRIIKPKFSKLEGEKFAFCAKSIESYDKSILKYSNE